MKIVCLSLIIFCSAPAIYEDHKEFFFFCKRRVLYKITQEENTRDKLIVVNFIIRIILIKHNNLNRCGDDEITTINSSFIKAEGPHDLWLPYLRLFVFSLKSKSTNKRYVSSLWCKEN